MKKLFVYLNIIGNIKGYLVAKRIFKSMNGDDGYFLKSIHTLVDDSGKKIENPTTTEKQITFLIPIPSDIITSQQITVYVSQITSEINALFETSKTYSFVNAVFSECYTDSDKVEMVYECIWKLKPKQVIVSSILVSSLLSIFSALAFIFF